MSKHPTILYAPQVVPPDIGLQRARAFARHVASRRSVRSFSPRPVPRETIEAAIQAAGSAPSGANLQPWHFVAVSSPSLKSQIRQAAEAEERDNYSGRMSDAWLEDLAHLGTSEHKPMLEEAPWLIAVFREVTRPDGQRNYYTTESVGIAVGLLLTALHTAGLATLTHTPSPMRFLAEILGRPKNEKAYVLIPVGYPAEGCRVPDIQRKDLGSISTFLT